MSVKKTAIALSGLLVALLMFIQQPYLEEIADKHQFDSKELAEEGKPQAEYQIIAYEVLLPVMQFSFLHSFDLQIEIPVIETIIFSIHEYIEKAYHNFFELLFRQFISPNAP